MRELSELCALRCADNSALVAELEDAVSLMFTDSFHLVNESNDVGNGGVRVPPMLQATTTPSSLRDNVA
jgi:hypothetical protein